MGPIAWKTGDTYKVALFYRYVVVEDTSKLIEKFTNICGSLGLLGRILVGKEGINGTLAGSVESIDQFAVVLKCDERFKLIDMKYSTGIGLFLPFLNLSIREVDEIVSSGAMKTIIDQNIQFDSSTFGGITGTGVHLKPNEFHEAIKRKDGVVLDIRNKFEYDIGHFDGSIGLDTFYYSETWDALIVGKCGTNSDQKKGNSTIQPALTTTNDSVDCDTLSTATQVSPHNCSDSPSVVTTTTSVAITAPIAQDTNIYMYCTGGIRCEKASAYLRAKGFNNVYQLEGGIHKYLEEYPQGGTFHGKNFVFDSRVSMGPTPPETAETAETAAGSANTTELIETTLLPQSQHVESSSSSSSSIESFSGVNRELNDVSNSEDRSDETIVHQAVVGRCIDCSAPHDTYSGYIACTVCRMPVLVCPQCVTSSAHPGEYHCVRHRDLKEVYFTVLDRYSTAELHAQRDALQKLLDDSLQQNKIAVERALRERTAMKRSRKSRSTECTAVGNPDKDDVTVTTDTTESETSNTSAANASQSKNRRNTLRKQIERISALIGRKHAEPDLGPVLLGQQKNEHDLSTSSETYATTDAVSPPVFVSAVERVGVESVDPAVVPGVLNPKSRGGWGFWRS